MRKHTKRWERQRWVHEWRRSRLSAVEFCEKHRLRPATLYMWARAVRDEGQRAELVAVPKLVEAVPIDGARRSEADWDWELEGPSGVLRGRGLEPATRAELVTAVTRSAR